MARSGALEGLRVVDITVSVAGPFATQILGDLGADVIKIERPGKGDDTRGWGPPFWDGGESATFLALNRNKRSLALDLKSEDGRAVLHKLLETADVLVQNMRPGALARLGFDPDEMIAKNPRLIVCDMSGFGPTGPMKDDAAYDPMIQAFGGLMSLTGEPDGAPVRIPASILDQGTAMWTVIGVLEALRSRETTGRGGHVQTSLLNTSMMWLPVQMSGYFGSGYVQPRLGSATIGIAPYQAFPTSDGYIIIAAGSEKLWNALCPAIDRTDLLAEDKYATNKDRVNNRAELAADLSVTLQTQSSDHWVAVLKDAHVPATKIQTLDQVAEHPQVEALGAIVSTEHSRIENLRGINLPVKRDGEYFEVRMPAPDLGKHTRQVLAELGYSVDQIENMIAAGNAGSTEEDVEVAAR